MRVVLAEDLALLRDGMIRLLTAYDFEVVEAVDNGPSLLRALTEHRPDVAVVDVRLPPTFTDEGLRAALAARAQIPGSAGAGGQPVRRAALCPGAARPGHRRRRLPAQGPDLGRRQFVDAIRRVAAGGTAMDPEVISQLLSRHQDGSPVASLTPREREVLSHMAEGRSNIAIAGAMFITEKAVGKHTNSIFGKLGLEQSEDDNRRVLAVLAYLEQHAPALTPGTAETLNLNLRSACQGTSAESARPSGRPPASRTPTRQLGRSGGLGQRGRHILGRTPHLVQPVGQVVAFLLVSTTASAGMAPALQRVPVLVGALPAGLRAVPPTPPGRPTASSRPHH